MKFVLIPPGEFDMGSTEEEVAKLLEEAKATKRTSWYIDRLPSEAPKHRVRITKPFYLGLCEVTKAQYERVTGTNPSDFKDDATCPVEAVTWDEASAFCRKLCELPQEQGRERSIGWRRRPNGSMLAGPGPRRCGIRVTRRLGWKIIAWYGPNAGGKDASCGSEVAERVGPVRHARQRLRVVSGLWADGYYATSPLVDPRGAPGGSCRAVRGGTWGSGAGVCRAAARDKCSQSYRTGLVGFRLARSVSLPSP